MSRRCVLAALFMLAMVVLIAAAGAQPALDESPETGPQPDRLEN